MDARADGTARDRYYKMVRGDCPTAARPSWRRHARRRRRRIHSGGLRQRVSGVENAGGNDMPDVAVLAATDPANPYGATLKWPSRQSTESTQSAPRESGSANSSG